MHHSAFRQFAVRARLLLLQDMQGLSAQAESGARLWFMRLMVLRFQEAKGLSEFSSSPSIREALLSKSLELSHSSELFQEEAAAFLPSEECLRTLLSMMPEISPDDPPELLGWVYQYFQTDRKKQIFQELHQNIKLDSGRIPAATQTFTPGWITRYLTENALSLLYPGLTGEYLVPAAPQPEAVRHALAGQSPRPLQELTILDPCMGTGHILADAFDRLMELYIRAGIPESRAARQILEQNLWGLELDPMACGTAKCILRLKAARYDSTLLCTPIAFHIGHFPEGSILGSLANPETSDAISSMLNRQYDAVITNPPYMGSSSMDPILSEFVRQHYPDSKADLFAVFMERCAELTAPDGCFAMITQYAWMFLSSFRKLRQKMRRFTLQSLLYLGSGAFSKADVGTIVQTCAFVCRGRYVEDYRTTYVQLSDTADKAAAFHDPERQFVCTISRFDSIPGNPLCFWISDRMLNALRHPRLSEFCHICQGMTTSDNKRFVRRWYEIPKDHIAFGCPDAEAAAASGKTWFPYNKGGRFRKWYGNNLFVVNYRNNGEEMRAFHAVLNRAHSGGRIKNADMYFRPAVTWPFITENTRFGVRFQPEGFLFDVSGSSLFPKKEDCLYLMGLLSSRVTAEILRLYNPTMNYQVENIGSLPFIYRPSPQIDALVQECICIAKEDWDSTEMSWDFACHPLAATGASSLAKAFEIREKVCLTRTARMEKCERELNRIFIEIYGLTGELSPEPDEGTLQKADRVRDVRELVQFAAGCCFGRYAIPGFSPKTGCFLPLWEDGWLHEFLKAVYGEESLPENLQCMEDLLGEPILRYLQRNFYRQHCRMYHRRPIYFLVDSGRARGFYGLLYLHGMGMDWQAQLKQALDLRHEQDARKLAALEASARPDKQQCAALRRQLAEQEVFAEKLEKLTGVYPDPDAGSAENQRKFSEIVRAIC